MRLVVLRCIGELATGLFLLGIVLGIVLFALSFRIKNNKKRRLVFVLPLLVYAVCEFLATCIYQGTMSSLGAVIVGAMALGSGLAVLLCKGIQWFVHYIRRMIELKP